MAGTKFLSEVVVNVPDSIEVGKPVSAYQVKLLNDAIAVIQQFIIDHTPANLLQSLLTVDGAGSGLDTDVWHGASFDNALIKKTDIPDLDNLNNYTTTGMYAQLSSTFALNGDNYPEASAGLLEVINDGQVVYQKYRSFAAPYTVYYRSLYNSVWRGWFKEWHSNNDGTGSGLDADLLDGLHSTSFGRLAVAQSWTAEQTFKEITETYYNLTGTSIDPANGTIQMATLSASRTFTEALVSGQSVTLHIVNGITYGVTFPTTAWVSAKGNVAPTLTTHDVIVFWKIGTTLFGALIGSAA